MVVPGPRFAQISKAEFAITFVSAPNYYKQMFDRECFEWCLPSNPQLEAQPDLLAQTVFRALDIPNWLHTVSNPSDQRV